MKNKTFQFHAQMGVGDKGEADFLLHYTDLGPLKSQDRAVDFTLRDGKTVELKTDTYPMTKTKNFFMEILSDSISGKLGGPFRARQDNVDFFVYYFLSNRTFFWFETISLCDRLETLIASNKFRIKSIKNRSWTTHGYAVPRSSFEDIQLKVDVASDKPDVMP